jgi:hypothetical protein
LETIEYLFNVSTLLVKLLPSPDFFLDSSSSGISSSAVDVGALINNALESMRVGLSKVLDATSFFDVDGKLLLQKRWQALSVSAANVASLRGLVVLSL